MTSSWQSCRPPHSPQQRTRTQRMTLVGALGLFSLGQPGKLCANGSWPSFSAGNENSVRTPLWTVVCSFGLAPEGSV